MLINVTQNSIPVFKRGSCGRDCMVVGLQLPVHSVPITTIVVSSNPVHAKVYSIQHYAPKQHTVFKRDSCGRDCMVVGFTTTCTISAYHHYSCEFESCSCQGVLNTTLCDKVFQWLAKGQLFSPGAPVSSTNNTDCHNITEILLKVVLNTINQTKPYARH